MNLGDAVWGWIEPVAHLFGEKWVTWARRGRLKQALKRFPGGRTLEALRRAAGEASTDEGRERTRELLRGVKSGALRARELKRPDPKAEEMWGLRSED